MSKVAIVTDSTNCLPRELIERYGIRVAACTIIVDGKSYLDEVDVTGDRMCEMLPTMDKLPTTTGVLPGEFVRCFEEAAAETDQVLCVVLSKAVSVTYIAAGKARDKVLESHPGMRIEIVDSKAGTGAVGFIALEAARAAERGMSLAEVRRVADEMVLRVNYFVGLHSLKYLNRIGRMPASLARSVNGSLQTKTVITVSKTTGEVEAVGRYRGLKRTVEAMIAGAKEHLDPARPAHFMVHYSQDPREAEPLRKAVLANFRCAEFYVTRYSAVTACSLGLKFGMSFFS